MLRIENLSKSYSDRCLFEGLTLDIERGKSYAIIGENGSGKSTLLKIIMGLEKPETGELFIADKRITRSSINKRAMQGIAYASQFSSAIQTLTVKQNLSIIGALYNPNAATMLHELNLRDLMEKRVQSLSGGEMKRLEIFMALATRPQYLLLDEPFSGIDLVNSQIILRALIGLKSNGIALIIAEHNVNILTHLADEIILLSDQKVSHWHDWGTFKAEPMAAERYFADPEIATL